MPRHSFFNNNRCTKKSSKESWNLFLQQHQFCPVANFHGWPRGKFIFCTPAINQCTFNVIIATRQWSFQFFQKQSRNRVVCDHYIEVVKCLNDYHEKNKLLCSPMMEKSREPSWLRDIFSPKCKALEYDHIADNDKRAYWCYKRSQNGYIERPHIAIV